MCEQQVPFMTLLKNVVALCTLGKCVSQCTHLARWAEVSWYRNRLILVIERISKHVPEHRYTCTPTKHSISLLENHKKGSPNWKYAFNLMAEWKTN